LKESARASAGARTSKLGGEAGRLYDTVYKGATSQDDAPFFCIHYSCRPRGYFTEKSKRLLGLGSCLAHCVNPREISLCASQPIPQTESERQKLRLVPFEMTDVGGADGRRTKSGPSLLRDARLGRRPLQRPGTHTVRRRGLSCPCKLEIVSRGRAERGRWLGEGGTPRVVFAFRAEIRGRRAGICRGKRPTVRASRCRVRRRKC